MCMRMEAVAGQAATLVQQVTQALRRVIDPELGENIVDLGLIYDVTAGQDGAVRIRMTTTSPGCPAAGYLTEGVIDCASELPGVVSVDVEITHEPEWSPDLMSEAARERLGLRD